MQSYTAVPIKIRRRAKMLYVWYLRKRGDWDTIHEENDVIETSKESGSVKKQLKQDKHTYLVMRTEHLGAHEIVLQQNRYKTM